MEYKSPVGWLRQMWVRNESQEGLNGVLALMVGRTRSFQPGASQRMMANWREGKGRRSLRGLLGLQLRVLRK